MVFAPPFSGRRQHPTNRIITVCGRPERARRPRSGGMDSAKSATSQLPPVQLGKVLQHDFIEPLGLTQNALAKAIGVTPMRASRSSAASANAWSTDPTPPAPPE